MMYVCEYCDSECHSASALLACEIRCQEEQRDHNSWTARYDFHRKD